MSRTHKLRRIQDNIYQKWPQFNSGIRIDGQLELELIIYKKNGIEKCLIGIGIKKFLIGIEKF